jgi:hypothetical protein
MPPPGKPRKGGAPACRSKFRYQRHFVYWRTLSNGDIGIVTILHERMHQIDRFRDEFASEDAFTAVQEGEDQRQVNLL